MNPTPAAVRAHLHALLEPLAGSTAVEQVLDHETNRETDGVRLTVELDSITQDFQTWAVRIYVPYLNPGPQEAAHTLDEVLDAVDDQIATTNLYGPSSWDTAVDPDLGCVVARSLLRRGREGD